MSVKRFHSRRSYRRMILWGSLCLFVVILCLLAMDITGYMILLFVGCGMLVFGAIAIASQARKDVIAYELGGDALLLRRGDQQERLPLEKVMDANLIDLMTARDYVQQQDGLDRATGIDRDGDQRHTTTRYCGVPIPTGRLGAILTGLNTNSFRRSLVLLRIHDGGVLLLSPRYSERMVTAIGKAKGIIQ